MDRTWSDSLESVALIIAGYSLIFFTWAIAATVNGNYMKAVKLLGTAAILAGASSVSINLEKSLARQIELPNQGIQKSYPDAVFTPNRIPFGTIITGYNWNTTALPKAPPPIPKIDYPLDKKKAEAWIQLQHCAIQKEAARKYVDSIAYINHEEFIGYLKDSIQQFNKWLKAQGNPDYAIIIPKKARFTKEIKSNTWFQL